MCLCLIKLKELYLLSLNEVAWTYLGLYKSVIIANYQAIKVVVTAKVLLVKLTQLPGLAVAEYKENYL